jgi:uncharacterized protein YbaP (TraB family)
MKSSSYYRDMKTRLPSLIFVAVAAVALGTSTVQAQLSKPFLWELSKDPGKDGTKDGKVVTLFGSLHVGKPDFYPVPDAVQKRFDQAKVLAVEVDITVPETQQTCSKLAATKETLESVLAPEDFAALSGYIRAAGIPETAIEGRKLWLVNLVVLGVELGQLGIDFSRGLDVVFLREAKYAKMKIVEVEGGATQCGVLAAASTAETKAAMTRFLAAVRQNRMEKRLIEMLAAYRAGDGIALNRLVADDFGDTTEGVSARRRIFDDRHSAMADKIEGYFKLPENHFVVIGVGHMFGDNNLLEALAKRGIRAKRIE